MPILLSSFIEGAFGFILTFGSLGLLFYGFQWVLARFFGTHVHGRFQAQKARDEQDLYKAAFEDYLKNDPKTVEEAIKNCENKRYSKTHSNVLSEIKKIEKEKKNEIDKASSFSKPLSQKVENIQKSNELNNIDDQISKLEKINTLRKFGGLSDEEFMEMKRVILNKSEAVESEAEITNNDEIQLNSPIPLTEYQQNKAMQTINMLYFENKDKLDCMKGLELDDIHKIILGNLNTIQIVNSYDNLYSLYSSNLINEEEFITKKQQLITNVLKE